MATTNSHCTPLSDVVRELDPNAPPAAPPDLLSIVSSLFVQRQAKLRKEKLARQEARTEARYVAAQEKARKKLAAWEEAEAEWLDRLDRALVPSPRVKDTSPSKEEIEALIDYEVAKEANGPGLRRAKHETEEEYERRMSALEYRVDCLDNPERQRKQSGPAHYVDGFPVNLVMKYHHVRPIPKIPEGDFSCIQCKFLGRRCGRTSDEAHICESCARIGRRCLVKNLWTQKDKAVASWKFAQGQLFGYDNLGYERRKWVMRLKQKGKIEGIQALPVWPDKKDSDGKTDQQDMPKRWQDYLGSTSRI